MNKNLKLSAIENKTKLSRNSHLTVISFSVRPLWPYNALLNSLPSPSVDLPLSFSFSFPFPFLLSVIFPSFLLLFQTVQAVLWKTKHAPTSLGNTYANRRRPHFFFFFFQVYLFTEKPYQLLKLLHRPFTFTRSCSREMLYKYISYQQHFILTWLFQFILRFFKKYILTL